MIHTVKGFGIVNKAEIDVFAELSCFSHDPADVGNLISGSSAFSVFLAGKFHGQRSLPSYSPWGQYDKAVYCHPAYFTSMQSTS